MVDREVVVVVVGGVVVVDKQQNGLFLFSWNI